MSEGGDPIDARGAFGVLIGDHGTQINYYYGRTATDGVAPPPLVTVSGEIESPYRGLAAFEERDAAFYCGREIAVDQVLERMSRLLTDHGLLVVSGASGAGKSSLLRAGVLPRIRGAGLAEAPEARDWPCLVFTPGPAPLDELAVRTAALAGIDAISVRTSLEAGPAAFALTARQAALRQSAGRLLLVVDQFEQLFTRCPDPREQRAFISALHAAATLGHDVRQIPAALVVLVVRADFEARCADHPPLTDAVQNRYLVTAMTRRQLRTAITEPAARAGSGVDEALVEILLKEVRGAGSLPLLSHALDQAWRRKAGERLTVADYERTGGIEGAIAASAQNAYERLTREQRDAAREVFTRLSAVGDDSTDIARRAEQAELFAGKGASQSRDISAVLESFASERLLTLAADTVELSHEVLLNAWPLLRDEWLAETRTDRLARTRLQVRAAEWVGDNRDPSYLYRGNLLQAALNAAARTAEAPERHLSLSRDEQDFLLASRRAHRRSVRRRRAFVAFLMALIMVLGVVTVVAYRAGDEAFRQRDTAASNQVAVQSADVDDPTLARLQSVAAWRINPSPQSRYAMKVAAARDDIATLTGHDDWVLGVTFTPDGRTLASVGDDNTLRLWDVAARRQIGDPLTVGTGPVLTVAISHDGRTLATGGTDDAIHLWSVAGHRHVAALKAGAEVVGSVAFSPDGKMLANSNGDGSVRLWNLATRRQVATLRGHPGHTGSVEVAFSPDGRTLVTAAKTVQFWDAATYRKLGGPLTGHTDQVSAVKFAPDGKTLATAGETVRLWDTTRRRKLGTLPTGEDTYITSVSFTWDGSLLASGDSDGAARLWDIAARHQVGATFSSTHVGALDFAPDGKTLATAGHSPAIRLWNTARAVGTPIRGHTGSVNAVVYSPDGRTIVTAGNDRTLRFWDARTRRRIGRPLTGHTGPIIGAAYSPDGSLVATTSGDGTLRLWDTRTRKQQDKIATERKVYVSTAFSPDGTTLAIAGETGPVRLWRLGQKDSTPIPGADNPNYLAPMSGVASGPTSLWVAFSPDGRALAAAHGDEVRLWDLTTHQQIGRPFGHSGLLTAMAFAPDGTKLATGSKDETARLWDVAGHNLIGTPLTRHTGAVDAVVFSPSGDTLATLAGDGVRLWDVATRQQIGTPIADAAEAITMLAFSPDGRTLAGASAHGHVRLWTLDHLVDDLPRRLCAEAGRTLTSAEWAQYVPPGPAFREICP
ncbi:hypothetical protein [Nonomuraea jiangxiensis]|uniref:WD40 repeat n=1 Tax=Nonomuraea jiangxiensis TaxID=633440 RepID=A0A1G9ISK6_9ACTN|nr:hypothetical protein [Nonomuraea jiangxiensis]SDL28319.1 WD40 repeat [Nonomuraea jiangxiensis]